jgi:hypothetical protein
MATLPRSCRARIAVSLLAVFPLAALAQSAPPPANMPRPACAKPDEFPGRLASDRQLRAWQNDLKTYGDCVKKFVEEQKAASELAIKAANAAAEEFNALVKSATDEAK